MSWATEADVSLLLLLLLLLQSTETATHRWCVYVRGVNHEDMSHVVQKVGDSEEQKPALLCTAALFVQQPPDPEPACLRVNPQLAACL
jgi:hypothetical protein